MKLVWCYLSDEVNHAGIWEVDIASLEFFLGIKTSEEEILENFNRKIIPIKKHKWFIPKFLEFQYKGKMSYNNNCHRSAIEILKKHNLYDYVKDKGLILNETGVTEEETEKDKVIDKEIEERFNVFWNEYPRKQSKKYAFQIFKRINPSDELCSEIVASISVFQTSGQWADRNFIPLPSTFLNQERWKDEDFNLKIIKKAYEGMEWKT